MKQTESLITKANIPRANALLNNDQKKGKRNDMKKYNIVRFYLKKSDVGHPYMGGISGGRRLIKKGLTLEEAKAHCNDPETSSETCTNSDGRRRLKKKGPWFDGYTEA